MRPIPTSQPISSASGSPLKIFNARDGLVRLDAVFLDYLAGTEPSLRDRLIAARSAPDAMAAKAELDLLIKIGPHLEDFIAALFCVCKEIEAIQASHAELAPLLRDQTQVRPATGPEGLWRRSGPIRRSVAVAASRSGWACCLTSFRFATSVTDWLAAEGERAPDLDLAARYAPGRRSPTWAAALTVFRRALQAPRKVDPLHLVQVKRELPPVWRGCGRGRANFGSARALP